MAFESFLLLGVAAVYAFLYVAHEQENWGDIIFKMVYFAGMFGFMFGAVVYNFSLCSTGMLQTALNGTTTTIYNYCNTSTNLNNLDVPMLSLIFTLVFLNALRLYFIGKKIASQTLKQMRNKK
jgi:hypothetical protein